MLFKNKQDLKEKWIIDTMNKTNILDKDYLSKKFDDSYVEKDIELYNSVHGEYFIKNPMSFVKELDDYIIVENGAFYINHDIKMAPEVDNFISLRATRDFNKGLMKKYKMEQNFLKVAIHDGKQGSVKRNANSFYGNMINPFSPFYNYDIASSTTIRGRSTVTINSLIFESVLGSYRPYRVEIFLDLIEKCRVKDIPAEMLSRLDREPSVDDILSHLLLEEKNSYYGKILLMNKLNTLTTDERKKVYYSNNFRALINTKYFIDEFNYVMKEMNTKYLEVEKMDKENDKDRFKKYKDLIYLDAKNPPAHIKDRVNNLLQFMSTVLLGFYWFEGDTNKYGDDLMNTQERFRDIEREIVILNDTDSLIFYTGTGIELLYNLPGVKENTSSFSNRQKLEETIGSFIIGFTGILIEDGLWTYTGNSNIHEPYRKWINYKQEYNFRYLQPTKGAKNYIGEISCQEGNYLPVPEIDLKGLSLKKSNFNKTISGLAQEVVIDDILKKEKPDIKYILRKISDYRKNIIKEYKTKNNLNIFTPVKLNTDYETTDPSDHRIKAVEVYNRLFGEDSPIPLPGTFLVTKIDFTDKEDELEENFPREYKILKKYTESLAYDKTKKKFRTNYEKLIEDKEFTLTEECTQFLKSIKWNILTNTYKIKEHKEEWRKKNKEWKDTNLRVLINALDVAKVKLEDVNKIAIPIDNEEVPEFITYFIDIDEVTVFDNLVANVVEGLGILTVRNNDGGQGKQIVHNIISYY